MYSNIRGLKGKKTSLLEILHENKPDVFLLTETQARSNINEQIDSYIIFGRKREDKTGGGVAILIHNDLRSNITLHVSDRNIEIMWVSIRRKSCVPFFIGTYYGKQESRTSKNEIEQEMELLEEEIMEMKDEGEIILIMDGNAKIGLLGENVSRNGKYLTQVFTNTDLNLMNKSSKCKGKITRRNTKRSDEFSAIDFVLASNSVEDWINCVLIDEEELFKIRGKNETDHNTIVVELNLPNIDKKGTLKQTGWNLRAPPEKWALFSEELKKRQNKATDAISCQARSIDENYKKWYRELDNAARMSIGKTTLKPNKKVHDSIQSKELRQTKKQLRYDIQGESNPEKKNMLIQTYKEVQEKARDVIVKERSDLIMKRFNDIMKDRTGKAFWKEKKYISRDQAMTYYTVKNDDGLKQFLPDSIKETTAKYFEDLYRAKEYPHHPYHNQVTNNIFSFETNHDDDDAPYNRIPTIDEISEIVQQKKNGKSTPDLKNEMLKRPGETMIDFIYPLIKTIWIEESIPSIWNTGTVTCLYKGKGDKEDLRNYRGITTSSAIGTIFDSLIDKRIDYLVPFTQAQGGGKKGASTSDHLFIMRAIIDLSIKQKRETFITFYDVSKAYDNVNNEDMLSIIWEKGLRGKAWRILRALNTDLKASIKTRFGLTRTIDMEIGGKQGSRLTGKMFSKLMDTLAEEMENNGDGFQLSNEFIIAVLLWVDDVVSCAEGNTNQEKMLQSVAEFAVKHKLQWSANKCKVMRVGRHKEKPKEWQLGHLTIQEASSYKYLGDLLTSDGKNKSNIEQRKSRMTATTVGINSIASTEVLRKIETAVLLELHEKVSISALLTNAESWTLNKGEITELERIEVQSLKYLFDLPSHTPTPAIIFALGTLYTNQRVDQKRFIRLHHILNQGEFHWTYKTLMILDSLDLGWSKSVKEALNEYDLPTDYDTVKHHPRRKWIQLVKTKIEAKNKQRLINDCHRKEGDALIPRTKTASILPSLQTSTYTRKPSPEIVHFTKQQTKTLLIARYGMLECGTNFKGTMKETCTACHVRDDENHRLNICPRYRDTNLLDSDESIDFQCIFSNEVNVIMKVLPVIERVWNTKNAHGTVHR